MKLSAEEFNDRYPIGTKVVYQPVKDGEGMATETRSPAWSLGHGAAVVAVEGRAGGVAVAHITVIAQ